MNNVCVIVVCLSDQLLFICDCWGLLCVCVIVVSPYGCCACLCDHCVSLWSFWVCVIVVSDCCVPVWLLYVYLIVVSLCDRCAPLWLLWVFLIVVSLFGCRVCVIFVCLCDCFHLTVCSSVSCRRHTRTSDFFVSLLCFCVVSEAETAASFFWSEKSETDHETGVLRSFCRLKRGDASNLTKTGRWRCKRLGAIFHICKLHTQTHTTVLLLCCSFIFHHKCLFLSVVSFLRPSPQTLSGRPAFISHLFLLPASFLQRLQQQPPTPTPPSWEELWNYKKFNPFYVKTSSANIYTQKRIRIPLIKRLVIQSKKGGV